MAKQIHLREIKDAAGNFTGDYECSKCELRFRPNPRRAEEMNQAFAQHKRMGHVEEEDPDSAQA
jgi:hypothetical protein